MAENIAYDLLNCAICYEPFKDPRMLSCGHTFCTSCLQSCLDMQRRLEDQDDSLYDYLPADKAKNIKLPCPNCRELTKVGSYKASSLVRDFKISQIRDFVESQNRYNKSGSICCNVCRAHKRDTTASHLCVDCMKWFCKDCKHLHLRDSLFAGHKMEPVIDKAPTQTSELNLCKVHLNEQVKYSCEDCKVLLCMVCAMDPIHQNHHKCTLQQTLASYSDGLAELQQESLRKSSKFQKIQETAQDMLDTYNRAHDQAKEQIQTATMDAISALRKQETELLKELEHMHDNRVQKYSKTVQNMTKAMTSCKQIRQTAQTALDQKKAVNVVSVFNQLVKDLAVVEEIPTPDNSFREEIPVFSAVPNPVALLGQLGLETVNKTVNYDDSSMEYVNMTFPQVKVNQRKLVWKIDQRGSRKGQVLSPVGVSFLPNNFLVVSELDAHRLQIFDSSGYSLTSLYPGAMSPRDVTASGEGTIYTIDNEDKTVKIFNYSSGQNIRTWRPIGLHTPKGIALTSLGKVVITDKNSATVNIYEPNGQHINSFGALGQDSHQMLEPTYVTADSKNRIIVSAVGNKAVKVFSEDGTFLFKIDASMGYDLHDIQGVCVDDFNYIYIAQHVQGSVSQFSSDGRFIRQVLGPQDQLRWPTALAINSNGHIAITETDTMNYISGVKVFG